MLSLGSGYYFSSALPSKTDFPSSTGGLSGVGGACSWKVSAADPPQSVTTCVLEPLTRRLRSSQECLCPFHLKKFCVIKCAVNLVPFFPAVDVTGGGVVLKREPEKPNTHPQNPSVSLSVEFHLSESTAKGQLDFSFWSLSANGT